MSARGRLLVLAVFSSTLVACTGSIAGSGGSEGGGGPGGGGAAGSSRTGPGAGPGADPTGSGSTSTPGAIAPGASGPTAAASCGGKIAAAPADLRRLLPEEYVNTARDLLNAQSASPRLEPPVGDVISALEVEKLALAASDLVALKGHHSYVPCDVNGPHNPTCADGFIEAFGRVAFRRPIDAAEKTWLRGVYDKSRQLAVTPALTFRESIDSVAQVILQSPQLVYIHEAGVADPKLPAGVRRLTGYERATRLSYLFWSSTPDKALLEAAQSGRIDSAEGVRAEAQRLLGSPRARKMVRRFASSWLELDGTPHHPSIENFEKNAKRFPFDSQALRAAWRADSEALYERIFFEPGSSFRAIMTSTQAYVNGPLAQLYGVTTVSKTATESTWVDLDKNQRAGLFTRGAFLAVQSTADSQDPIHRGVFVFRHVLCQPLPDPPADVDNTPPKPLAGQRLSTRQLVDLKTSGGVCSSCHALVNPIGYALENYNAMGGWQTTDTLTVSGQSYTAPIDANATIPTTDLAGPVAGGVALATRIGDSAMARDCAVETWFTKALAHKPGADEACLVTQLKERFRKADDLRELVLSIASSDAALFIKEPTP